MNRTVLSGLLLLATQVCLAGTSGMSPGSSSITGPSSNHYSLYGAAHNPAMADMMVSNNERLRMSYFVGFGTNTEIGDANGFIDEVDELIDILDDPSSSDDSIEDTLNRFNDVLVDMGDEGYVKNSSSLYLPLAPLFWKPTFAKGTFFSELSLDVQWRLGLLDSELRFNDQNRSFETGSAAYIKSGIEKRLAFGYGQQLFDNDQFSHLGGKLFAGFKLNIYNLELSKQVFQLQLLDGKDIEDVVKDEYENNLESTTSAGLDLGLLWVANKYRVGLTLKDLNQPEFKYGAIGTDCLTRAEGGIPRSNCELTAQYTQVLGEINANEVHVKPAVATADLTVFLTSRWTLSSSADLVAYDDIVGTQNQWSSVATAYYPKTYWLPSLRLAMLKNVSGSKLSSYGIGLTFFKMINLDASVSSDKVIHEDNSVPRRFSFSLSIEETF